MIFWPQDFISAVVAVARLYHKTGMLVADDGQVAGFAVLGDDVLVEVKIGPGRGRLDTGRLDPDVTAGLHGGHPAVGHLRVQLVAVDGQRLLPRVCRRGRPPGVTTHLRILSRREKLPLA